MTDFAVKKNYFIKDFIGNMIVDN